MYIRQVSESKSSPLPPPSPIDPDSLLLNRPTCPSMWYQENKQIYSLPLAELSVIATFHVSTAVVNIKGTWFNTANRQIDCLFSLPLKGTVTSSIVRIGEKRILETAVVAKSDMENLPQSKDAQSTDIPTDKPSDQYIPDLFRIPIQRIPQGEFVRIDVSFLEPLEYYQGRYHFNMALKFPSTVLPQNVPLAQIIHIDGIIDSFVPNMNCSSSTHALVITKGLGSIQIQAIPPKDSNVASDFNLSYDMSTSEMVGTLIKEGIEGKGEVGNFVLFVTPPTNLIGYFPRSIIFLIDRSGSMTGDPYKEAARALQAALGSLRKEMDYFNIIAFDHEEITFSNVMLLASDEKIAQANSWVDRNAPEGGGTEIGAPLSKAINLLKKQEKSLPFVFLLTDGAVKDEREICRNIQQQIGNVRVLTFGIGSYCNWYFLKMLAQIGRGFSDVCVYQESIFQKAVRLLEIAAIPVLTNITLTMPLNECEVYPFPIPDLFVGGPLMIAGKYRTETRFPDRITMKGVLPDGRMIALDILTMINPLIPVNKVFLKQRLDLLTARAWLEDSKNLEKEVIEISIQESMPCAYTTMVAFEVNEKRRKEIEEEEQKKNENKGSKEEKKIVPRKSNNQTAKAVAAVAVGGVIVLGVAAFAFGDVAATLGNLAAPLASGLASGVGVVFDAVKGCGCFSLCSGCCGSCFDIIKNCCGSLCGCCSNADKLCGECIGVIGSACGWLCSGGCFHAIGDCCGTVVGSCAPVCSVCIDIVKVLFSALFCKC